jgi:pseudouridine-5'-monophosphatase
LLPGVEELLADLKNARGIDGKQIEIAMASSSTTYLYSLRTSRPQVGSVFKTVFTERNRILGDNPSIKAGKPSPDIYLLALDAINENKKYKIKAEQCLVLEDSVVGVEAGRRAGMRVIWVPHAELKGDYEGWENDVLAGRTGSGKLDDNGTNTPSKTADGWGCRLGSLVDFPYETYGIKVGRVSG